MSDMACNSEESKNAKLLVRQLRSFVNCLADNFSVMLSELKRLQVEIENPESRTLNAIYLNCNYFHTQKTITSRKIIGLIINGIFLIRKLFGDKPQMY